MKYLTYLASPYTFKPRHGFPITPASARKVENIRANEAAKAAAWLIREYGWNVFSPIAHSHALARIGGLQGNWEFWRQIDTEFLDVSQRIVILCIPGWDISTGVTEEIEIAKRMGCEVQYLLKAHGKYILSPFRPSV